MDELEFLEVVTDMCRRPRLRTGTGSFFRVVMFLEGYALGVDLGRNQAHSKMTPFLTWCDGRMDFGEKQFTWTKFREQFDSDEEALAGLEALFSDFAKEQRKETHPSL